MLGEARFLLFIFILFVQNKSFLSFLKKTLFSVNFYPKHFKKLWKVFGIWYELLMIKNSHFMIALELKSFYFN